MRLVWFLRLVTLGLVFYADICAGAVPPCGANWFGSPCRYKCHCENNNCDINGECTGTSTCERGWFGPACQYVDLVSTSATSPTPAWVYDFSDSRCNAGQGSVTIVLNDTFYFTWLRLRVNSTGTSKEFTLQFANSSGKSVNCRNMQTFAVSDTALDIQCDPGVWFQQVTITGDGVKSLCSVYISGGRNVALGQDTSQTSTNGNKGSWLAVDGDINPSFEHGSCTHTRTNGIEATWTLTFLMPHQVTRYDLYNRNGLKDRLQGFILDAYQGTGSFAFRYIDTTGVQNMYRIQSGIPQTPVSRVTISATKPKPQVGIILTLCEVEMFGDVVCPSGKHGRECKKSCNCADEQTCLVSTGMCPSGCAAGYQGKTCSDPCNPGYYGNNCSKTCSTNCPNQLCNASTGNCLSCKPGKQGLLCDQDCAPTYWGDKCAQRCSSNCKDQFCDNTNGACVSCVAGKFGANCIQACKASYYGEDCVVRCSANCWDQVCNAADGRCISCVAGKTGQFCDQDCAPTYWGDKCAQRCSSNCKDQFCDNTNGACVSCVAGKFGANCIQACKASYYGEDCVVRCSANCWDQVCNAADGRCISCVAGKTGQFCDQECNATKFGRDCREFCSKNCTMEKCDPVTGKCLSCVPGLTDDFCNNTCSDTFYGDNCTLRCSSNCTDKLCNPVSGNCHSCVPGKIGQLCDQACPVTTFGQDCRENCSTNCTDTVCDAATGACLSCIEGTTGAFCDKMLLVQPDNSNPSPGGLIAGLVVALVILVTLIVIGVLVWRRCSHTKDKTTQDMFLDDVYTESRRNNVTPKKLVKNKNKPVPAKPSAIKKPNLKRGFKASKKEYHGGDYCNVSYRSETAIRFTELDNFMAEHGKDFYEEQFSRIPANNTATIAASLSAENQDKNRYKNISAYDHSRVHLQTDLSKNHGDYINASFVEGFQQRKQFIASQGPTKIILEDFVRMLSEQGIEVVVMLTNLIEDGKLKCEQYWPDDGEINIGEVTVKLTTTQVFADYTIRRLCLYKQKSPPVQVLTHFHFTTWPDKDVPTTAWGLVDLEQRMASISTSKPIVVHCSAGVGRTGTFIALHNILEAIKHTGYMDVFTTVQKLRQDRMNMVQTFQQYEFLHRATQIAMVCRDTTVTSGNIRERTQLLEENSESGQSKLDKEFKAVCLVCAENECGEDKEEDQENNTYCNSIQLSNGVKHQVNKVLPKEHYRPALACETGDLGDYSNAVLIPSCEKHDQQILTQLPSPTTEVDFWRLVTQYKVSLIVAFERHLGTEGVTIGDYLPQGEAETKNCSFFNIQSKLLDSCEDWELQRITVTVNEETIAKLTNPSFEGEYILPHLSWKSKDLDAKCLLTLMGKVRALKPAGEGRTLFTCRNGAELSGLACTLSLLLDRMDNDQHVSVPLVVGTVKSIRPQIVPTLEQYRLLYQVLNLYNETTTSTAISISHYPHRNRSDINQCVNKLILES